LEVYQLVVKYLYTVIDRRAVTVTINIGAEDNTG
jgi:hypothetical protein